MIVNRQHKIYIIIALVIAISSMTIGFAAFSNTLTISSSATVTPNNDDFKMVIYGMKDANSAEEFNATWQLNDNYLDNNISYPAGYNIGESSQAIINNTNMSISNINAKFSDKYADVAYYFIIKNEGKYDGYLDYSNIATENESVAEMYGQCTPEAGTTKSLVDAACTDTPLVIYISDSTGTQFKNELNKVLIAKGEYIILLIQISYNLYNLADGPFNITYPNVELNFTTQP